LEEAAQQITDKISDFRSEQNEALRSEIIDQNRNSRFNNNHPALIFGSFDQAKEQHQPLFY